MASLAYLITQINIIYIYRILNAFNSLLSRSRGITLKRPSYKRRPMTRHRGSIIPIMPVSDGLPIRS